MDDFLKGSELGKLVSAGRAAGGRLQASAPHTGLWSSAQPLGPEDGWGGARPRDDQLSGFGKFRFRMPVHWDLIWGQFQKPECEAPTLTTPRQHLVTGWFCGSDNQRAQFRQSLPSADALSWPGERSLGIMGGPDRKPSASCVPSNRTSRRGSHAANPACGFVCRSAQASPHGNVLVRCQK